MRSNNNAFALFIKLRPACSTEDLQHIQDADIDKRAFFSIVYLCTLKNEESILDEITEQLSPTLRAQVCVYEAVCVA